MPTVSTLKLYYILTKPGIIRGNVLIASAGYLFGAAGDLSWGTFIGLIVGISSIIASACVYNNILDRDIDKLMKRTKKRALVEKTISVESAAMFGTLLLMIGVLILLLTTNTLAVMFALIGHVAYVILYTFCKRVTIHGTLLGTISGATPPVVGYVAATNTLDVTALLLFLLLVAWQMPHFYSIAIFRFDDYKNANIPVLPVIKGYDRTRKEIVIYSILFLVLCVLLGLFGGASLFTVLVLLLAGGYWLYLCLMDYEDIVSWSKKQFVWSLSVLLLLSATLSLDHFWR